MVELLRPDQGRIVKIDPRDKRIAEIEEALRAIAPHLKLSFEPTVSDCLLRSRADALRRDADRADAYDAAVRKVREALKSSA